MINNLLDEGKEEQIKMIVVDEIHLLADQHRGFLSEVILSKVQYILREQVQIVGMSATLPNISDLSGWLGASLYRTEFRPVDLSVRVCMNRKLYRVALIEDPPRGVGGRVADSAVSVPLSVSVSVPVVKSSAVCNNPVSIYSIAATNAANIADAAVAVVAARVDAAMSSDIDVDIGIEGDRGRGEDALRPSSISVGEYVRQNSDDVIMDIEGNSNSVSVPIRSVRYRPTCLTQLAENMRISDKMACEPEVLPALDLVEMEMEMEMDAEDKEEEVEEEGVAIAGKGALSSLLHPPPCTTQGTPAPAVINMTISSDLPDIVDPELEPESPPLKVEFDTSHYDFEFIREIPPMLTQGPGSGSGKSSGGRTDPDGLYALCVEPLLIGKSVMLFCPSKGRCEVCASEVARIVQTCAALSGGDKDSSSSSSNSNSSNSSSSSGSRGPSADRMITRDPKLSPLPPIQLPDRTAARSALLNELRLAPVRLCEVMTSPSAPL